MAQRQLQVTVSGEQSSLTLRNRLLIDGFLDGQSPDPEAATASIDPVYGDVDCGLIDRCYTKFSVQVQAVQRAAQLNENGEATVLLLVALTPDDSATSYEASRRFGERLASLDDLTGGTSWDALMRRSKRPAKD